MDGPGDGDGEDKKPGKIIKFPGGRSVDSKDIGAGYVVGQTGDVPTPDIVDQALIEEDVRRREKFVESQELVRIINAKGSTADIIDEVLKEIGEELAHLKYERKLAADRGKNTAQFTINRISSLKSLAEVLLKRKEAALAETLDLKSPRFQSVFKVWMDFFYESMEKCNIESQVIDLVFQQMKADMVGWESKMDMSSVE